MAGDSRLSWASKQVLKQISEGRSYDQVLAALPTLKYLDIFAAAKEALELLSVAGDEGETQAGTPEERRARRQKRHARAGEKWTDEEDTKLTQMHAAGEAVAGMKRALERSTLAVTARLLKLGLVSPEAVPGLERLNARRPNRE